MSTSVGHASKHRLFCCPVHPPAKRVAVLTKASSTHSKSPPHQGIGFEGALCALQGGQLPVAEPAAGRRPGACADSGGRRPAPVRADADPALLGAHPREAPGSAPPDCHPQPLLLLLRHGRPWVLTSLLLCAILSSHQSSVSLLQRCAWQALAEQPGACMRAKLSVCSNFWLHAGCRGALSWRRWMR